MKRPRPWLPEQEAQIMAMRRSGMSNKEIARATDRSPDAIRSRFNQRLIPRKSRYVVNVQETFHNAFVQLCELPEFYALGWRVVSFGNGMVKLEWRCGEPKWPAWEEKAAA